MNVKKKTPKSKEGSALLIWGIPSSVKRRFKVSCTMKGETMRQAIIRFMEYHGRIDNAE